MKNFMVVALFASAALIGMTGAKAMPIAPLAQDAKTFAVPSSSKALFILCSATA